MNKNYTSAALLLCLALTACSKDDLSQRQPRQDLGSDQGQTTDMGRADLSAPKDLGRQAPDMRLIDSGADQDQGTKPDLDAGVDLGQVADLSALTMLGTPDRPVVAQLPSDYKPNERLPLILLLHGYATSAGYVDVLLGISDLIDTKRFILVAPEGTRDLATNRFWNATPGCCDYYASGVDDLSYLEGLLEQAKAQLKVDTKRVYVIGHSNGAFMANTMACQEQTSLTASVTFAGTGFGDPARCKGGKDVHTLHIHGTNDEVVYYLGNLTHPGAERFVERWVERHGCDPDVTTTERADLMLPPFEETLKTRWTQCEGASSSFWRMDGATHNPILSSLFSEQLLDTLLALERP